MLENSIEEIIVAPIKKIYNNPVYKFHSGGREDIDVRMLGKGRPFILEIISPCLI